MCRAEGGAITVTGHSAVLDLLATSHSEGVELGAAWLEAEGELHLPVHLSPSVTVSVVQATSQTNTVTVLPLISSCRNKSGRGHAAACLPVRSGRERVRLQLRTLHPQH